MSHIEMKIPITTATGRGSNELSAFDAALVHAGIANMNLLPLSSVIPPNTEVIKTEAPIQDAPGTWGDRLYIVRADARSHKVGESVWAGIGWVQHPVDGPRNAHGLFVEHTGGSQDEVESLIHDSLADLQRNRGGMEFEEKGLVSTGITCEDSGVAVCALAAAVYQASDWNNQPEFWQG